MKNGMVRPRNLSSFQSVEDRDATLQSGMARGAIESGERLSKLIKKVQKGLTGDTVQG